MTTTCNLGIDVITIKTHHGNIEVQSDIEWFMTMLQKKYNHGYAGQQTDEVDDDYDPDDYD